ncbi:MAG: amidase [Thalassolituus oleivorans]|jgi:amidase
MRFPEYETFDAVGLAGLVRTGELTPSELLETAIERTEIRNPALNAVIHKLYESARASLESLPAGPFRGVPFLIKDLESWDGPFRV